jgi:acetyltransferase-like isoleucine patch superfamily enzyme
MKMPYGDLEYKLKKVGKNVVIGKNVYIRYPEEFECGDNVIIDEFCYFTTKVKLGSYIHIAPSCTVIGGKDGLFIMGDFCGLSAGCHIACSSDDYLGSGLTNSTIPPFARAKIVTSTVEMKRHSLLGTGVTVHPSVVIGEGSVVGSMSLVTKSLDPWGVYVGVPVTRRKDRSSNIILMHGNAILPEKPPEAADGAQEQSS